MQISSTAKSSQELKSTQCDPAHLELCVPVLERPSPLFQERSQRFAGMPTALSCAPEGCQQTEVTQPCPGPLDVSGQM